MSDLQLTSYDATLLLESKEKSDYFEKSLSAANAIQFVKVPAKSIVNWINGDLSAGLNEKDLDFGSVPIRADRFAKLVARVQDGTISQKSAKEIFADMWDTNDDPDLYIEKKGLKQISDSGAVEKIVDEALAANAKLVEDYRAGKEKAFNALVGQVMKRSQGKANPAQVNEILHRKLKA